MENLASMFGMSAADLVTVIGGVAMGIATIIGAVGRMLATLHGAKKRSFQKIRRLEDLAESLATGSEDAQVKRLVLDMKSDQRDVSDEKDAG